MFRSEKFKKKMSEIAKSKGYGKWMKGKKHTPETIKRMKIARARQIITEEHKRKIGEANKGKKRSLEIIHQMSLRGKGRISPKKGRYIFNFNENCFSCGIKISRKRNAKRCKSCAFKLLRGQNHPNWKGGVTSAYEKIRKSLEYKLWRKAIYERDNYTCIWCGDNQGGNLEADHIKPFAYFPELRFALDNGRTLCKECHKKTDSYLNRWYKRDHPKVGSGL